MLKIIPTVDSRTCDYLKRFCSTKRQQRVAMVVIRLNDYTGLDYCLSNSIDGKIDIGSEGAYYAYDNSIDDSVIDTNIPPQGQPDVWCNISISDDGSYLYLKYDSRHTKEWINYIDDNFIKPFGYRLEGNIEPLDNKGGIGYAI